MQIFPQKSFKGISSFTIPILTIGNVKEDEAVKEVRDLSYIDAIRLFKFILNISLCIYEILFTK